LAELPDGEIADVQLGRRGRLITALGSLYAQQLANRPDMMEHFVRTPGQRREIEMARGRFNVFAGQA
jgi:hypothetical protein